MKRCTKCKEDKPIGQFNKRRDGLSYWCKDCYKTYRASKPKSYWYERYRWPKHRFTTARKWAGYRKIEWTLTLDDFISLIYQPCFYCGGKLPETGSGLDRTDNTKGYEPSNVVPCCAVCNQIKSNIFSQAEMIEIGKVIHDLWRKREKDSSIFDVVNGTSAFVGSKDS